MVCTTMTAVNTNFSGDSTTSLEERVLSFMTTSSSTGLPQCSICQKVISTNSNLRYHIQSVHLKEKPHLCNKCGKTFASKHGHRDHVALKHPEVPMEPVLFGAVIKKEEGELTEEKLAELTLTSPSGKPMCGICKKVVSTSQAVLYHIRSVHYKLKLFKCSSCNKDFSSVHSLKGHLQKQHPGDPIQDFPKGTVATKTSSSETVTDERLAELLQVRSAITGLPKCDICQKEFSSKPMQKYHITRVHFNMKAGSCHLCGLQLSTLHGLRGHLKTVHGETDSGGSFVCEVCGESFQSKLSLSIHKGRIHYLGSSRDLPGRCQKCDVEVPLLLEHMKLVHAEKKLRNIECPTCGFMFSALFTLKRHLELGRCKWVLEEKAKGNLTAKKKTGKRKLKGDMNKKLSGDDDTEDLQCEICCKVMRSAAELKRHQKGHMAKLKRTVKVEEPEGS